MSATRIQLNDVFKLSCPVENTTQWVATPRDIASSKQPYDDYQRGKAKPKLSRPYQLKIAQGRKKTDVLRSMVLTVNQKVVDLWREAQFTGWKTYPVQVFDRQDKPVDDRYFGVAVIGRAGHHDTSRGVTKWYTRPDGTKSVFGMNGLYFDVHKWDGSDFFMLEEGKWILVTRRVVESLKEANITGWVAKPVLEIRF
ncbi:MAG: hypothetical protein HS116_23710 [Planctomycetes bacterium]|nr:hypothetical protein [Planctomycetota bacterium]